MNSTCSSSFKTIAVLGDGAWGTAIASLLANNGHSVILWCYDEQVAQTITTTRCNQRYMPGVLLHERIQPTTNLTYALDKSQWVFEAIPVKYLRAVIERVHVTHNKSHAWVLLSKGIEHNTLKLPSHIVTEVLGLNTPHAVVSGPSFAHDLINKQLTAFTVACADIQWAQAVQLLLANDYCYPDISNDPIGVQVGGACKNVIALAVGMLAGAGYSDNTQAFLITRGLQEIVRISQALGGTLDTLYGLSGVGDLLLTSMGKKSKNRTFGSLIGQDCSFQEAAQQFNVLPEGVSTVKSLYQLIGKKNIDVPVCMAVYRVLFEQAPVTVLVNSLTTTDSL